MVPFVFLRPFSLIARRVSRKFNEKVTQYLKMVLVLFEVRVRMLHYHAGKASVRLPSSNPDIFPLYSISEILCNLQILLQITTITSARGVPLYGYVVYRRHGIAYERAPLFKTSSQKEIPSCKVAISRRCSHGHNIRNVGLEDLTDYMYMSL
jgi:hypothetical protein